MEKKYYLNNEKALLFTTDETEQNTKVFEEEKLITAFAETLREARNRAGLSLPQLARAMQIPQATLSAYELKTRAPSLLQAIRICAFFECSIEDFIAYGLDIGSYDIVDKFCQRVEAEKKQ